MYLTDPYFPQSTYRSFQPKIGCFTAATVSADCNTVALADSSVYLFDLTNGHQVGEFRATEEPITSLALSRHGNLTVAGLEDGNILFGKLNINENSQFVRKSEIVEVKPWESSWNVHPYGAITALEFPQIPLCCGNGKLSSSTYLDSFVAIGTRGGYIKLIDVETGLWYTSLVGGCSCEISQLCMPHQPESSPHSKLMYASYSHRIKGHGHYNGVYVWDITSASRIGLLFPSGRTINYLRPRKGEMSSHMSDTPISAFHADGYKIAVASGRTVTVFDSRTWNCLYYINFELNSTTKVGDNPGENKCLQVSYFLFIIT